MSNSLIAQALEVKLNALTPAIATAWENTNFAPTSGVAYQSVNVLFAEPENPTLGDNFYRQRGFMQVSLRYPSNTGRAAALARADLLRNWFKRGLSIVAGGVTTTIDKTPEITGGNNEGDRFVVIVRIRFYANVEG